MTRSPSATPATAAVVSKDQADCRFIAGQVLNLFYTTTTSGAYTVKDIHVTLFISTGRTDL